MRRVSIIIPTLNESSSLGRALRHVAVLDPPPLEVLVVDGGSEDETVAIAQAAGIPVISCDRRGRSVQMNYGANVAIGDILAFSMPILGCQTT